MEFLDRRDAGRRLALRLAPLAAEHPVVVALPRGGVPVGFEVAWALAAPLEILAVRKLGAPGNPELAVGAIAEDGTAIVDVRSARRVGMSQEAIDATIAHERAELERRVAHYRRGRAALAVRGRTVIVVDDGVATGLTDLAAVRALRGRGARRIIVAVPVGAGASLALLSEAADAVVCETIPPSLVSVGRWYHDFGAVDDGEVIELLDAAAERTAPGED
jgi:putative phosphoribosyl transferase